MFSKIRYSIAERKLARKARLIKRTKVVHNFMTCRKSAILIDATNAEEIGIITEFAQFLKNMSIKYDLIGFVDSEKVQSGLSLRDNQHLFCRKNLSLFYKPKTYQAEEFLKKKYNILFNLSLHDLYPLRYLSMLSVADFKVGRYSKNENDLDLMIDITKEPRLDYLIEQIKIYVSQLNNPETKPKQKKSL